LTILPFYVHVTNEGENANEVVFFSTRNLP
jgi:hypothetical protein